MNPQLFDSATWILALLVYWFVVFSLKVCLFPAAMQATQPVPARWICEHETKLLFSPDFWLANTFKNRIKQFEPARSRQQCLRRYLEDNNFWNAWLSVTLLTVLALSAWWGKSSVLHGVLAAMALLRYFSRSFEISFAFGRDVLGKGNSVSGLDKQGRIQLALVSYLEIYVYSAAAYLGAQFATGPFEAIFMSLHIGTLTNVAYAFPWQASDWRNLVFIQVICTISLVALSLAAYLSRQK